jgi:hypothetical protein
LPKGRKNLQINSEEHHEQRHVNPLTGLTQAAIFTALSMIFIGAAVAESQQDSSNQHEEHHERRHPNH